MMKLIAKFIIGVISDTHGILHPVAEKYLDGSNLIIHAGDIGKAEIINKLKKIAPVSAIKGNIDIYEWADELPETLELTLLKKKIFVIHSIKDLNFNPAEEKYDIIISGHSHKPLIKREDRVLFVNPGSAGKKRFNLPLTLGKIKIADGKMSAKIINL